MAILFAGPEGEGSRIVASAEAGLVVLPEDAMALAEAVRQLADDPSLRHKLATNSHAAAPLYSREMQARHMLGVLQLVVDGDGHKAATVAAESGKPS